MSTTGKESSLFLQGAGSLAKGRTRARFLPNSYYGAVYHMMNRGVSRQAVFSNAADYDRFLQLLEDCHVRWGVRRIGGKTPNNES